MPWWQCHRFLCQVIGHKGDKVKRYRKQFTLRIITIWLNRGLNGISKMIMMRKLIQWIQRSSTFFTSNEYSWSSDSIIRSNSAVSFLVLYYNLHQCSSFISYYLHLQHVFQPHYLHLIPFTFLAKYYCRLKTKWSHNHRNMIIARNIAKGSKLAYNISNNLNHTIQPFNSGLSYWSSMQLREGNHHE